MKRRLSFAAPVVIIVAACGGKVPPRPAGATGDRRVLTLRHSREQRITVDVDRCHSVELRRGKQLGWRDASRRTLDRHDGLVLRHPAMVPDPAGQLSTWSSIFTVPSDSRFHRIAVSTSLSRSWP